MTDCEQSSQPACLAYYRNRDGCDDNWDIYDTESGEVLLSIPFQDCGPEWEESSEARAELLAASATMRGFFRLAEAMGELDGWSL